MTITVKETPLPGLLIVEPNRFGDSRGFFFESFREDAYRDAGIVDHFVQDNFSRSAKGILRGLHYQTRRPQAQLVTVAHGAIFDVVVDVRPSSPAFGKWFGMELHDGMAAQLYMPPGFAHGFCVLSNSADVHYKVSRYYEHGDEGGVLWSDPDIGIKWPLTAPLLSSRDSAYPLLRNIPQDMLPKDPPSDG